MLGRLDNDISRFLRPIGGTSIEDPTFLGFKLFVQFFEPSSRLTNGSAHKYLLSIGENHRASMLEKFVNDLRAVVTMSHHYFRSIDGLETLYEDDKSRSYRTHEKVLSITTYESMDFRISKLMNMYRYIVYDDDYVRWVLPTNLRKISIVIMISEIRQIRTFMDTTGTGYTSQNAFKVINENLSTFVYEFGGCEINYSGINSFLADISNEDPSMVENQISFTFSRMKESHRMGFLESLVSIGNDDLSIYDNMFYTVADIDVDDPLYTGRTKPSNTKNDKEIDDGLTVYDGPPLSRTTKLENFVDDFATSKVGSVILQQVKSKSDSLAYVTGLINEQKSQFTRLLQPGVARDILIGLAIEYIDDKIKSRILGSNVFGDTGFGESLNNMLLNVIRTNPGVLSDTNVLSDTILEIMPVYELGRIRVYNRLRRYIGSLDILSDLSIDVMSQVATLSIIGVTHDGDGTISDLSSAMVIYQSIIDQFQLGNVELNDNFSDNMVSLLGNIELIDASGGESLLLSTVATPQVIREIVSDLSDLEVCITSNNKLDEEELTMLELLSKTTLDDKTLNLITGVLEARLDGNVAISADSTLAKMVLQNYGTNGVIDLVNKPITTTLGYISDYERT